MTSSSTVVDTTASIAGLVDNIIDLPTDPPSLSFDIEGIKLSRHGSVSILQLLAHPTDHVYLIDIHVLGSSAFSVKGSNGKTLKDILESPTVPKICFDVRNDSDALYSHFGIALQGIQDVQLMENASRPLGRKRVVNGLAKCIERDAPITSQEKRSWKDSKDEGNKLFAPERGGSYEVFNVRPLQPAILAYCLQDVRFLPHLRRTYWLKLSPSWKEKVEDESRKRVQLSQSADYQGQGEHKAIGPWPYG